MNMIEKNTSIFENEDLIILANSVYFDKDWYLATYLDVLEKGVDPYNHYLKKGWIEGRNPSLLFYTNGYLDLYHDVKDSKVNPLIHYLKNGRFEGRCPGYSIDDYNLLHGSCLFDESWYCEHYGDDVKRSALLPEVHYLIFGWKKHYNPSPFFDTAKYLNEYFEEVNSDECPLVHYLSKGIYGSNVPFFVAEKDSSSKLNPESLILALLDNDLLNEKVLSVFVSEFEKNNKRSETKELLQIINQKIDNRYINVKLAEIFFSEKNYVKSGEYFSHILDTIHPNDCNVLMRLCACYIHMNDFENANQIVARIEKIDVISDSQRASLDNLKNLIIFKQAELCHIEFTDIQNAEHRYIDVKTLSVTNKLYQCIDYKFDYKILLSKVDGLALYFELNDDVVRENKEIIIPINTLLNEEGFYSVNIDLLSISNFGIYYKKNNKKICCYSIKHSSDDSHKVLKGENGFLFLQNDINNSVMQFEGKLLIKDVELNLWKDYLNKISNKKNILLCIPPAKESVYTKYYPISKAEIRPIDQLSDLLRSINGLTYLYAADLLSVEEDNYPRTETHWNYKGALIVLKEILNRFNLNIDDLDFTFDTKDIPGDLGIKLKPCEYSTTYVYSHENAYPQGKCVFQNHSLMHQGSIYIYENESAVFDKSICVFGDSFSDYWIPYLRVLFRRYVAVRSNATVISSILEHEKCDYVICENTERFILRSPTFVENIADYSPCIRTDFADIAPHVVDYINNKKIPENSKDFYECYMRSYFRKILDC